ncbi:hypothetical protein LIA77_11747 [Sarocladium implicatum]|nr:hypothetical protein LIA77_11747 [Sarocladium implicatum]
MQYVSMPRPRLSPAPPALGTGSGGQKHVLGDAGSAFVVLYNPIHEAGFPSIAIRISRSQQRVLDIAEITL